MRRTWCGRARRSARAAAAPQQRFHPLHAGDVRRADLAQQCRCCRSRSCCCRCGRRFIINKISYWARTTIVPLMVLAALKPRAQESSAASASTNCSCRTPHSIGMTAKAPHQSWGWFLLFRGLDSILRAIEPLFPKKLARAARSTSAVAFIEERLNGEDGLGAIYPPMANTVMMYEVLGKRSGLSAARDHAKGHRQAAGDRRARGLLPALRLAGVGHRR